MFSPEKKDTITYMIYKKEISANIIDLVFFLFIYKHDMVPAVLCTVSACLSHFALLCKQCATILTNFNPVVFFINQQLNQKMLLKKVNPKIHWGRCTPP